MASPILADWLGHALACSPPHLSSNETGVDLIAVGQLGRAVEVVIGEVKAYESDPLAGFSDASTKFIEVQRGDYNDEIRSALKQLSVTSGIPRDQLAANVWTSTGRFGAVIGCDSTCDFDGSRPSTAANVMAAANAVPGRVFFVVTPHTLMRQLMDKIAKRLKALARTLT